jgi:hypothetical protein
MEKIEIAATPTTPRVVLDPDTGLFEISGKSLPENSYDFFQPLQEWLDLYAATPQDKSSLVFRLEYFNTSSTSHFLKLIKKMEKIHNGGKSAEVLWYHDHDDEDMKEAGEDFKLLVKLPIAIIATDMQSDH